MDNIFFYVVQVRTGQEQYTAEIINRTGESGFRAMFLQRRMNIRRGGKNLDELQPLFPGYVFIKSDGELDTEQFSSIKNAQNVIRFLPANDDIRHLDGRDDELIRQFVSFGEIAEPSLAYFDRNDRIVITDGPMKGLEGLIVSVDRRKRRVKLVCQMFQSQMTINLSYNLIEKTDNEPKS